MSDHTDNEIPSEWCDHDNSTSVDEGGDVPPKQKPAEPPGNEHHVEIGANRIAEHYNRVRPVYKELGSIDENPTIGVADLTGWYITRDENRVDRIEDGYTKRRRPTSFVRDLDRILDRVDRTIYGLTTYKDPDAFRRWTPARFDEETGAYEYKGGDNPTPEPEDLRAVAVWGDIDLCDHLKTERGNLDDETIQTAEATLEAYAEEFGKLVGGTDAVYTLDSVGGAYVFTAPEVTLPIVNYVTEEYDEVRAGVVLREVIKRSNEWLKDAQERVEDRIDGATDVIDPDWANNHNRTYKAPLSIHKDHEAVVTPVDPEDIDYQITYLDDVDEELIADAETWASQFTAIEYTDRVDNLVEKLFTSEFKKAETWRDAIDAHIQTQIEAERRREDLEQARQQGQGRDRDLDLSEFDITPSIDAVKDAIDNLDVERVADDTIVKLWTKHEAGLTDRSGSGKKAIVPIWADGYNSGNATYIDLKQGIFNDTDSNDHGTVVEMALIDAGGWPVGKIARGSDWIRGLHLLREKGYEIPVWTPDAKAVSEEKMPYWALRDAAVALGTVDEDDLIERDSDDGGSYLSFPDAATYNAAIETVEDAGLVTDREPVKTDDYRTTNAEPIATLPNAPGDQAAWFGPLSADQRHKEDNQIQNCRDRTTETIANAYQSTDRVLIEALPTLGKTYGAVKAAADTGVPTAILTTRGRKEQYDAIAAICEEFELSYTKLPAFSYHCETARGVHGEELEQTVHGWYNSGATPKQIHKYAEDVLGSPLPCQEQGDGCGYAAKWSSIESVFDADDPVDVLIGHYTHAHKRKVTAGRAVAFDEFPGGAFEMKLKGESKMARVISTFLDRTPQVPFEDYTDLLECRADDARRTEALAYLIEDLDPDPKEAFDDQHGHAYAPLAVFTLLASENLGNGWERAEFPDDDPRIGVFDREQNNLYIQTPPDLSSARSVAALDGTPTPKMWELALNERLHHRTILADDERQKYLRDTLNLNIVSTTESIKPYAGGKNVNTQNDMALLEEIVDKHGTKPGVITSSSALSVYKDDGALEFDSDNGSVSKGPAEQVKWYGNVLGSNEFKHTRVGAVIGSNHYGDSFVKKWGAYAGESVERNDEKGTNLSYGSFGDRVLTHMREHDTLQAAMRFGRDGNGATVYVHTNTLPEWVPIAGEGRVVSTWSDGCRQVLQALEDLQAPTSTEIADHSAVEIGSRQVFDHLEELRERGVLERQQDSRDGRRVVWLDDGLARLNEHGDVELREVSVNDLDDDEVDELARTSTYTWEFMNRCQSSDDPTGDVAEEGAATDGGRSNGVTKPPDNPE